jgi:hypothetical protein
MFRSALSLLVAAFIGGIAPVAAADVNLRVVRNKQNIAISSGERLATKLIALVESCSVNSTAYAVTGDIWAQVVASDSFVQVVFSEPRRIRLVSQNNQTRLQRLVREILLLPLPESRWPEHIFVKSDEDTLSFTKDNPLVLKEVVLEQDLRLHAIEPYKSLLGGPSKE